MNLPNGTIRSRCGNRIQKSPLPLIMLRTEQGDLLEVLAEEGVVGLGEAMVDLLVVAGVEVREVGRRETQSENVPKRLVRLFPAYEQPPVFVLAVPTILLDILSRLSMHERVCTISNKAVGTSTAPPRPPLGFGCSHSKRRAVYSRPQSAILLDIRRRGTK